MAATTIEIGEVALTQADGGCPTTLTDGSAPGESGVFVLGARFQGGLHLGGTPRRHHIWFQLSARQRFRCRIGDDAADHAPPPGSLAICPAGSDYTADADDGVDAILVAIDPRHIALVAAEDVAPDARLIARLSGCDPELLHLARHLAHESQHAYPSGPLAWNETASAFIDRLVAHHVSNGAPRARGMLGKHMLARLREHVLAHLDEPIDVATLARIAGRSPFHFTRVFARSVGMTPHRYVVHLRLRRAIELLREGRSGLAEIAACTGFADQSHLSRWIRRVHGASPTELVA
jgi:AraC family transcriptional regulator